ncbi:MAG: type II secretion system F family protein, partial [Thermodesulfobacteriota bacterium]|nr:type II secretion system F family protein [Thermodesulfobacteriota bacterium]
TWGALLSAFKNLGERISPKSERDLDKGGLSLARAGFRGENALVVFWGVKCALAVAMGLSLAGARFLAPVPAPASLMAVGVTLFALIGFYLPEIWLKFRISKRKTRILHALPDALDLLVVCVESGMGLDQALTRVGREMRLAGPELSQELKVVNLELRAGKMRREALKNLALRVGLEDMNSLVTMLIQADAFGASVADTLRVYSDALRVKRCQRAEEAAAKLPVKLLFPLVLFILPALFVVILGPAAIQLMQIFAKIQ